MIVFTLIVLFLIDYLFIGLISLLLTGNRATNEYENLFRCAGSFLYNSRGKMTYFSGSLSLIGLKDDEIEEYIKKVDPDVIGISCMYTAYSGDTHRLASTIKNMDKNIPVVVGGAHASTFPDLVLKDVNVDVVSHYEGEETFSGKLAEVADKMDSFQNKLKGFYKRSKS